MADETTVFTAKSAAEHRDDILRTIRNGLIAIGVENPNVTPKSDYYVVATAISNELVVGEANAVIKCDEQMLDTAAIEGLTRQGEPYDLTPQPAVGSLGPIVLISSTRTTVPTGQELIDGAGLRYKVSIGGIYSNGSTIQVEAIDTGDATNHDEDDILRWATPPPYCDEKVTVGEGGLVNGKDEEGAEDLRARLYAYFQNPPKSGNWQHCAELAEKSTPRVQKAFVHPADRGPATTHVVVTAAPTDTSKERDVDSTVMSSIVEPTVIGGLPEHSDVIVTTVANLEVDVSIGLSLPEATTASPPGPGGGWLDGTPWPSITAVTYPVVTVTAVTTTTGFTVDAQTDPITRVSRIAWLSPYDWKLYTATVIGWSGSAGAYLINIDTPFPDIAVGCYIMPQSEQIQAYVDALLEAFKGMGPAEMTTNVSALLRGFRHPTPNIGWPYSLDATQLRAVSDAGDEVLSTQYLYRTDGVKTSTDPLEQVSPSAPATLEDPPQIYVPRHLAFYRLP